MSRKWLPSGRFSVSTRLVSIKSKGLVTLARHRPYFFGCMSVFTIVAGLLFLAMLTAIIWLSVSYVLPKNVRYRALADAVMRNDVTVVERLAGRVDLDRRNWLFLANDTLLVLACSMRHDDVARVLLNYGADPNLRGMKHRTPLIAAVFSHEPDFPVDIFRDLLNAGADANKPIFPHGGRTPTTIASMTAFPEVVEVLLSHSSEPVVLNDMDSAGHTALHSAAWASKRHPERAFRTIELLLEAGADPRIRTAMGTTAADIAQRHCQKCYERILEAQSVYEQMAPED